MNNSTVKTDSCDFSFCIPAYNRAIFLKPLLNSILAQEIPAGCTFEIVICEDLSPQRAAIREVAEAEGPHFAQFRYIENDVNLGYDGNIRRLVREARGRYCFFMGNDDLLANGALKEAFALVQENPGIGFVLKSYAWFDKDEAHINQEVRYFSERKVLTASADAVALCFRRSGVISGFIIRRDLADNASTAEFDGFLYYQMHLVAQVVAQAGAVATPTVLVLCRNSEPPDFGASKSESAVFTPGVYTVAARLQMLTGITKILDRAELHGLPDMKDRVLRDYANYFFPYIRDQLKIPLREYLQLYRGYMAMGFGKYPMFHLYMLVCRLLGAKRFDDLTRFARKKLGRTVQFGSVFK